MFFVTSREYVGPDCGARNESLKISISRHPAYIIDDQAVIAGVVGEYDGWCLEARGAYDTLEAARQAVADQFCALRPVDPEGWTVAEYRGRERKRPRGQRDPRRTVPFDLAELA